MSANQEPLLPHTASAKNMGNPDEPSAESQASFYRHLGIAGIPNQLGKSGISSQNRSAVTKSFLAGQQGSFDEQDPQKTMEKQIISSARPGHVASVITNMMDDEQ